MLYRYHMMICIHSSFLGSERHLLCGRAGSMRWSDTVPDDAWVLDRGMTWEHPRDIRTIDRFLSLGLRLDLPERFASADEAASVETSRPIHTVPRPVLLGFIWQLLLDLEAKGSLLDDVYIIDHFLEIRRQLGDLRQAHIDARLWDQSIKDDPTPALESFEPDQQGLAQPVLYDQISSITGRLTVHSGPQILTLRRDHRKLIRPSKRGRSVIMLDFVSHEPRVALGIAGVDAPEDIYTWFRDEHCESVSRDNAKVAIIGTLYGMSSSTLAEKLDTNLVQARAISEIVRSTFGIKTLEAALLEEIRREGHIRSHFGRRIVPSSTAPGVLVNSYLQSTAMDLGMAGFRQVLASLAGSMIEVSPLFYIHDAMVVEVSDRRLSEVVDLSHREITIPGCPGTYRFKVKELTS